VEFVARKWRLPMRCNLKVLAICVALLPLTELFLANTALAETPAQRAANASAARSAEVEEQLDTITAKVEFVHKSLKDVLADLGDKLKADIFVTQSSEANVDMPITLRVKEKAVSIRTILELVLDQVDDPATLDDEVGYTIRDGVVLITKRKESFFTQVYDCRDLLAAAKKRAPPAPDPVQAIIDKVTEAVRVQIAADGKDPKQNASLMTLLMQLGAMRHFAQPDRHSHELTSAITNTVKPETWEATGGTGTVMVFNGLLVVKQSPPVHLEVQQLLNLLRAAEPNLPKNK
jgi:hypothetical protein